MMTPIRKAILDLLAAGGEMKGWALVTGSPHITSGSIYEEAQKMESEGLITGRQTPANQRAFEITDAGRKAIGTSQ